MNFNCFFPCKLRSLDHLFPFRKNVREKSFLPAQGESRNATSDMIQEGGGSWRRWIFRESGNRLKTPLGRCPNWQEIHTTYIPLIVLAEPRGWTMLATTFYGNHFNNHWNDSHLFFPLFKLTISECFLKNQWVGSICISPTKMLFRPFEKGTCFRSFSGGFLSTKLKLGGETSTGRSQRGRWVAKKRTTKLNSCPPKPNMTIAGKSTIYLKMYGSYWKWGIFQPVMLVNSGVSCWSFCLKELDEQLSFSIDDLYPSSLVAFVIWHRSTELAMHAMHVRERRWQGCVTFKFLYNKELRQVYMINMI